MYDVFFDVTVTLCDRFPAYTPTEIRRTPAHEVFLLLGRLIKYSSRQEKETINNKIIRKPAGDDWF